MINKREFTDIAKRVLRFHKGLKSPQIMHPVREWFTGLMVAVVIFGASAGWSAYMYMKYQNTSVAGGDGTETEMVVYRESLVNAALQKFSSRQEHHKELLAGVSKKETSNITEEVSSSTNPSVEEGGEATSTEPAFEETATSSVATDKATENEPPSEVVSPAEGTPTDIAPVFN